MLGSISSKPEEYICRNPISQDICTHSYPQRMFPKNIVSHVFFTQITWNFNLKGRWCCNDMLSCGQAMGTWYRGELTEELCYQSFMWVDTFSRQAVRVEID